MIKREWWQPWEKENVPRLNYILQSYDTAFSKKETSDYTAITTWGVFDPFEDGVEHLILLDATKGRYNFPELKDEALEQYEYWEPDMVLIEGKASGLPLADELLRINIPVLTYFGSEEAWWRYRQNYAYAHGRSILKLGTCGHRTKLLQKKSLKRLLLSNGEHDDFCDVTLISFVRGAWSI